MKPLAFALALALGAGLALSGLALPGLAMTTETPRPMTAAEFEAYATGKTLSYAQGAQVWGSEQYLPGRKVIWAFDQEDCEYGEWYEKADAICFVYEDNITPQCWHFYQGPLGLKAEFLDDPVGTTLSEVRQSQTPLQCRGPKIGV